MLHDLPKREATGNFTKITLQTTHHYIQQHLLTADGYAAATKSYIRDVAMDEQAVRALRQEISDLLVLDQNKRTNSGRVGWEDEKQHRVRIARINQIKAELQALLKNSL